MVSLHAILVMRRLRDEGQPGQRWRRPVRPDVRGPRSPSARMGRRRPLGRQAGEEAGPELPRPRSGPRPAARRRRPDGAGRRAAAQRLHRGAAPRPTAIDVAGALSPAPGSLAGDAGRRRRCSPGIAFAFAAATGADATATIVRVPVVDPCRCRGPKLRRCRIGWPPDGSIRAAATTRSLPIGAARPATIDQLAVARPGGPSCRSLPNSRACSLLDAVPPGGTAVRLPASRRGVPGPGRPLRAGRA